MLRAPSLFSVVPGPGLGAATWEETEQNKEFAARAEGAGDKGPALVGHLPRKRLSDKKNTCRESGLELVDRQFDPDLGTFGGNIIPGGPGGAAGGRGPPKTTGNKI